MRLLASLTLLTLLLAPLTSRADMLGPGEKGVKLSIQVDAEVPAGKSLVLVHTFRGADRITPGAPQTVEWHPLGGDMVLRLVAADKLGKLDELRAALERDQIAALVAGRDCHAPFPGVRTISDSSPTAEIRWVYRVAITGDTCKAELVRTDHLDDKGALVSGDPNTAIPPPTLPPVPKAPEPAKAAEPAKAPEPARAAEPAKAPASAKGCAGCEVGGTHGGASLGALLLLGLRRRRR